MSMSNKDRIRALFTEVFNNGLHDLIPDYYCSDCVAHDPGNKQDLYGHDDLKKLLDGYRSAFPDHSYELHQIIGEGDYVVVRWTAHVSVAYKPINIEGMSMCQFSGDKVHRVWQQFDNQSLLDELEQIGSSQERGISVPEAVDKAYRAD